MYINANNEYNTQIMPSSTSLLPSNKNKKKVNLNDPPLTPAKVLYKIDVPIYNLRESFCNILFDIAVDNKLINATQKVLQLIVISLAEIDKTITIAKYTESLPLSSKRYKLDPSSTITDALSILKFSLKLGAFFPQVKPKKGKLYTKLHFTYSAEL